MGYDVGVRINIDVLNAQSQLYTTQQSLAKARLDTLLALLRLKLAAGNLSETDIQAVNALLD
jgi:outer membrane protein